MKFEEKLISLRKSKGLSQEELAEYLGVSRQAISRWEAGSSTPDMTNLLGICEYFRVSSDYLIHDDYDSDEDIPIAKKKDSDIRAAKSRQKELRLAAAVCLIFAGLCFSVSLSISRLRVFICINILRGSRSSQSCPDLIHFFEEIFNITAQCLRQHYQIFCMIRRIAGNYGSFCHGHPPEYSRR